MTKRPKYRKKIEEFRAIITSKLTGAASVKRLNNINWLRHEISYNEPRHYFMFHKKNSDITWTIIV